MNAYLAEFFGTALLVLLGNGVVAGVLLKDSKAHNAGWLVIVLAWGLAVTLGIYAVGQFSGAHINPVIQQQCPAPCLWQEQSHQRGPRPEQRRSCWRCPPVRDQP